MDDEVVAIADQVPRTIVVSSVKEAEQINRIRKACGYSINSAIENVQDIIKILMTKIFDLRFVNTICFPTKRNQEQIKQLAKENDAMVIIGSFTSANSKRLTMLSKEINSRTYQVTGVSDIDISWFENCESVGIGAGASTPDYLIEEVKNKLISI